MKNRNTQVAAKIIGGTSIMLAILGINSCNKKNDNTPPTPASQQNFTMTNVVASDATFAGSPRVDAHLINAWGISFSPTGTAWISAADDHTSAVYNGVTGAQQLAAVTVPAHGAATGGSPTGQIFNGSTGFRLSTNNNPAKFIFAQEEGIISGWNGGAAAVTLIDRNATSVYTGLAYAASATDTLLYAADFKSKAINVFDKTMTLRATTFTDPSLPAGYSPFNIQAIGNQLYVTYAQVDPTTQDEKKGAGLGVVDVYNLDGTFAKRLTAGGALNAPWGVAQAPAGWLTGAGTSTVILIGNFGDGHINAYDAATGNWLGTLQTSAGVITIDGLWGISFAPTTATNNNPNWLYFAAGPADESKGLYGYIVK